VLDDSISANAVHLQLGGVKVMWQVGLETGPGTLSADDVKALTDERGLGANDRTKFTIRGTYKLFDLPHAPDFSERGWQHAQTLLAKRDQLMHPKSLSDFAVSDAEWETIYEGTTWLFSPLLGFIGQLAQAHGVGRNG
jgi:hypothetical protein